MADIRGTIGNDTLTGTDGGDRINGDRGDDTIDGAGGNDQIDGGEGSDAIDGGAGDDTLRGGGGIDSFKFEAGGGKDVVADLETGETVEIHGYAAAQSITQVGGNAVVVLSSGDQLTFQNRTVAAVQAALQFVDAPPPPPPPTGVYIRKDGGEFLVNTTTAGLQFFSSADELPGGGFVVTWLDQDQGVKAQLFSASGGKVGGEIAVNGWGEPTVTGLASGGFVVSWASGSIPQTVIQAQLFGPDGTAVGAAFPVYGPVGGNQQQDAQVFALASGGFAVAWWTHGVAYSEQGYNIALQLFGATGEKLGEPKIVNTQLIGVQNEPAGVALSDGGFVLVWTDQTAGGGDADLSIKGQRFNAAGEPLGANFLINTVVQGNQSTPDVAALPGGGFAVVWQSFDETSQAKVQIFDAAGNKVGPELLASAIGVDAVNCTVTALDSGAFLVAWEEDPSTGSPILNAQLFDAEGGKVGDRFQVNTVASDHNARPDLITLASGEVVAVWTNNDPYGDPLQNGIKAQILSIPILGTSIDDTLTGTSTGEWIAGLGGNDTINASGGNDELDGGDGADLLSGSAGDDLINGGNGVDLFKFQAGDGKDTINDLEAGETVVIRGFDSSLSIAQAGADVVLVLSSDDQITFKNASVATVQAALLYEPVYPYHPITGTNGDDELLGTSEADEILGFDGNDYMAGAEAGDSLWGGNGNDEAHGQYGNDQIYGEAGDDVLLGEQANDTVHGGEGADTIYGDESIFTRPGDGSDQLSGGAGDDFIYGGGGNDVIAGDGDDDSLFGGEGSDQIDGGDGNDYLSGNGGYVYGEGEAVADSLSGGAGNDTIDAGYGDVVDGGAGIDVLAYYGHGGPTGLSIDFRQLTSGGAISIGGGTISGIEFVSYISLSDLNDTVVAGAAPGTDGVTMIGWGGDDVLTGSSTSDWLYGETGNDILNGAAGDDFLHGGNGTDRFIYALGGGQDRIGDLTAGETVEIRGYMAAQSIAQVGADVVVVLSASDSITLRNVDLATVQAALRFPDAVPAQPTAGDDTLTGTDAANLINGLGGNDTIYGLGGNDTLDGAAGNDILDGGTGNDLLRGGAGNDTYYVDSALDRITESSGAGTDEVMASVNYTLARSAAVEKMTAFGSAAINLTGNELAQSLVGNDWDNVLSGAAGNDTLIGGGGADTLTGGLGADVLWGGTGADLFAYVEKGRNIGNDQVMDFERGVDKIDLHTLGITSANVSIGLSGGNSVLSIDADRNGRIDYTVALVGVTQVDSSDFIF